MLTTSSDAENNKTIQTSNTILDPINLEELRCRNKRELQEQRAAMEKVIKELTNKICFKKQNIEQLQCYLNSETEERQYLEEKLVEIQKEHKEELEACTQEAAGILSKNAINQQTNNSY